MTILNIAVGAKKGILPLQISNLHPTVSTLANTDWQQTVSAIAKNKIVWDETIDISVTTLDLLIGEYGLPHFCKIDVEGFEAEVLSGLTQAIPVISFEFFSFTPQITLDCLEHIDRLGDYEFNWSVGESQKMFINKWASADEILESIQGFSKEKFSGDIYAKLR